MTLDSGNASGIAWGNTPTKEAIMVVDPQTKVRENMARRRAKRLGLALHKSRARAVHVDDAGGWMIHRGGEVVRGDGFDLSMEDVEQFLADVEAALLEQRGLR
jgi:hypothetical protein